MKTISPVCQMRALKFHTAAELGAAGNIFSQNSPSADPKIATKHLHGWLGLESLIPGWQNVRACMEEST